MSREEVRQRGVYYTIIQGTFRQRVDQDHPEAQRRDFETKDGKKGTKYERVVDALYGYITDINFHDSEFGLKMNIVLDENEQGIKPIISLSTNSREAEDFMLKVPNIDLSKEVKLRPFNFTGDNNDEVRGMDIRQEDANGDFEVKITNFYYDAEKKENINGLPNPQKANEEMHKDDWKVYFIQRRQFLVEYIKEKIVPGIPQREMPAVKNDLSYPDEDINPDSIPF
jgi:hypothetical protein